MQIHDIFPLLKWIPCFQDEEEKQQLLSAIGVDSSDKENKLDLEKLEEIKENMRVKKQKAKKDFSVLGYGTTAYFDFHVYLIYLFFVLTVISIPLMAFYANYETSDLPSINKLQLGNLGFADV